MKDDKHKLTWRNCCDLNHAWTGKKGFACGFYHMYTFPFEQVWYLCSQVKLNLIINTRHQCSITFFRYIPDNPSCSCNPKYVCSSYKNGTIAKTNLEAFIGNKINIRWHVWKNQIINSDTHFTFLNFRDVQSSPSMALRTAPRNGNVSQFPQNVLMQLTMILMRKWSFSGIMSLSLTRFELDF